MSAGSEVPEIPAKCDLECDLGPPGTRLTNALSRKLANHRSAVALTVAHFNMVKMHSSIRMTPAMKASLVNRPWAVADVLAT